MGTRREPWAEREDWATGRLESLGGHRSALIALWGFTLLWNVVSWHAAIEAARGNATGQTGIAPIFPAIGLGLCALAIYLTLQHRRWGGVWLELQTVPGVLGGSLRCVLHAPRALERALVLRVRLDCRGARPGGGDFQVIRHLWHHDLEVPRARFELGGETRVPLDFRIPYGLPESEPAQTGDDSVWTLGVSAKVRGLDLAAQFDLPVFETAESAYDEDGSQVPPMPLPVAPRSGSAQAMPGSKIRVRPYGGAGTEFVFGMFRNPWLGLFIAAFTVFFCGLVAVIHYADGPGVFLVVFSAATLLLAYSSLDTLFGITRVRVERGRIQVRHGPFGIGPRRTFELQEIERIRVEPCWSSGSQVTSRIRIERRARSQVERRWRRSMVAGTRIPFQAEAESLADFMRETVGLR